MRAPYANKSHDDVEAMGEDAASAAEDVDQLRFTTGNNIRKWISTARMELNKNDETDRHILHRICTYVDRKRRTFEKNGYIMTKVVTGEMKQQCIFPSANFILPDMDPKGTAKRDANDITQLSLILWNFVISSFSFSPFSLPSRRRCQVSIHFCSHHPIPRFFPFFHSILRFSLCWQPSFSS